MIPKNIHYIWLGQGKKPKTFDSVLESWKLHGKGFEIREWTEKDAQEFNLPKYYYQAITDKQWALASDVLRVHILHTYGGLYFDIDQMLIKDIPESFLSHSFFTANYHEVTTYFGFAYIGAEIGSPFMKKLIDFYADLPVLPDGKTRYIIINKIVSDILNAEIAQDPAFYEKNNIHIYPQEYFYPLRPGDFTENTYSHHLGNTSWIPWYKKALHKIPHYLRLKKMIYAILPKSVKDKLGARITY